jgi:hypothetical protein
MSAIIHEEGLFSFDGNKIQHYKHDKNGHLEYSYTSSNNKEKNGCYSEEHENVGDVAFNKFIELLTIDEKNELYRNLDKYNLATFRKNNACKNQLVDFLVGEQKIRAGMLVSFGGYYSIPDEPIAYDVTAPTENTMPYEKLEQRFMAAFETLLNEKTGQAKIIANQIGFEGATIHGLIKRKARPSIVMGSVKNGITTWAHCISRSLGWKKHIPGGFFIGQYVQAATMNFDHFGAEAALAYEAGHRIALKKAETASMSHDKEKWVKFAEAITLELFACHFLADLFVSGHVRTPRRKVFEVLNSNHKIKKKWIASLFANLMHDEDNENGVYVCSKNHPEPWEAMGDYRYSDDNISDEGEKIVHDVLSKRLYELYLVFKGKEKWKNISDQFKNDIPREISEQWMDSCHSECHSKKSVALNHAKINQPYLKIEKDKTLRARPNDNILNKEEIMNNLADVLAKGIDGKIKEIDANSIKEITRIKPIIISGNNAKLPPYDSNKKNPKKDLLIERIFDELYTLDDADEVIIAIELPTEGEK